MDHKWDGDFSNETFFPLKHSALNDEQGVQKEVFIALPIRPEKVNRSGQEFFLDKNKKLKN